MTVKAKFEQLCAELMATPELAALASITENSPWHRESDVLTHTRMVIAEYTKSTDAYRAGEQWTHGDLLGGLACLFHDVGKPAAAKWSETYGRNTFHGHEQISASIFLTTAFSRTLSVSDRITIHWMIKHHVPFGTSQHAKLVTMGQWMSAVGDNTFERVLLADQRGRISDNHEDNIAHATAWMTSKMASAPSKAPHVDVSRYAVLTNMRPLFTGNVNIARESRLLIIPVGPSGSGKTTLRKMLCTSNPSISTFSWDDLRTEWYGCDYAVAFQKSVEHEDDFLARALTRFEELVALGDDIVIDNTNVNPGRTAVYVNYALQHRYHVVYVVLGTPADVCISRQSSRTDKTVPVESVRKQFEELHNWIPHKPSQVLFAVT